MTYSEGRPWAVAIKEEVLARRMPPWGAVKGFGDFRNDQALTPEQLELVVSWVDGGVPEGEDKDLPSRRRNSLPNAPLAPSTWRARGKRRLHAKARVPAGRIISETVSRTMRLSKLSPNCPDGSLEPLLWLSHYKTKFGHAFLLRTPLDLPAGTVIRGVPKDSTVILLPAAPRRLLQLFHRNIKVHSIHNALPLELHPYPVRPRTREL